MTSDERKTAGEIVRIISEQDVETQEQLLAQLELRGIRVTQATVSRDIKELHLVKVPAGNGAYRYAVVSGQPRRPQPYRTAAQYFPGGSDLL